MNTLRAGLTVALASLITVAAQARTPLPPEESQDKMKLGEGEFVVTLERDEDCSTHALNFEQSRDYGDGPLSSMATLVRVSSYADEGLIRPAVCRSGKSSGTIKVKGPTTLVTKGSSAYAPLKIAKVKKVERTAGQEVVSPSELKLRKGLYAVTLTRMGSCMDEEINIDQQLDFTGAEFVTVLKPGRPIYDNLMRPAICRRFAIDTGVAIIDVKSPRQLVLAEGMSIKAVDRITKTSDLEGGEQADTVVCRVPDLYDAGYNVEFNLKNKRVKSMRVSQISILGGKELETVRRCHNYRGRSPLAAQCRGRKVVGYLDATKSVAWLAKRGNRYYTKLECQAR